MANKPFTNDIKNTLHSVEKFVAQIPQEDRLELGIMFQKMAPESTTIDAIVIQGTYSEVRMKTYRLLARSMNMGYCAELPQMHKLAVRPSEYTYIEGERPYVLFVPKTGVTLPVLRINTPQKNIAYYVCESD